MVDDNVDGIEMLAELLRLDGATVHVATSAAEALELLDRGIAPSHAIIDIGLPGSIDGIDLGRMLRARLGRATRIIAFTGFGQAADVRRTNEAGFDAHVTKPADVAALRAALLGSA